MTESEITEALHRHLEALSPTWTTKPLVGKFDPSGPYQRGTWMPGDPGKPVAWGAGAYHRQPGVYQIDVFYPKLENRWDLLIARATALKDHFYPTNGRGGSIEAGDGLILIDRKPHQKGVDDKRDKAFDVVTVDVYVRIELPPAA